MTPPPVSGDRLARAAVHAAAAIVVVFAWVVALQLPDTVGCPAGSRPVASDGRTLCQPDPRTPDGTFRPPTAPTRDRHVAPRVAAVVLASLVAWFLLWRPRRASRGRPLTRPADRWPDGSPDGSPSRERRFDADGST